MGGDGTPIVVPLGRGGGVRTSSLGGISISLMVQT